MGNVRSAPVFRCMLRNITMLGEPCCRWGLPPDWQKKRNGGHGNPTCTAPPKPTARAYPHLVWNNPGHSGGAPVLGEVPLELLEGVGGKAPTALDPHEELAVVDDQGGEPGLGNAALFAEARRIVEELVFKGHASLTVLGDSLYAGLIPHLSTGKIPQPLLFVVRDNVPMALTGFLRRIQQRLDALGITANAASLDAGLDRDYIGDLFKGRVTSPRMATVAKLAKALRCDPNWLWSGEGEEPDPEAEAQAEARDIVGRLPEDLRQNGLTVLRALEAEARQREAARKHRRKS